MSTAAATETPIPQADAPAYLEAATRQHCADPAVAAMEGGHFAALYLAAADTLDAIQEGKVTASAWELGYLLGVRTAMQVALNSAREGD